MVVGRLGIESILVSTLVFILRWWSGLMVGILRIGWHFGDGCFEEEMDFGRMPKHISDFG